MSEPQIPDLITALSTLVKAVEKLNDRMDKLEAQSQVVWHSDSDEARFSHDVAAGMPAGPGTHHGYRLNRPLIERTPKDVWPTTLDVTVDAEAPRTCMYSVLGGPGPCRQPAWYIIPRNEHCKFDMYGCRDHAPLMAVTGSPVRRLVRPTPPA